VKRIATLGATVVLVVTACVGGQAPATPGGTSPSQNSPDGSGSPTQSAGGESPSAGGSGSPAGDNPYPNASGTVKWLVGLSEDPTLEPIAQQVVERFHAAYPNIELQREGVENDQLRTILQTRLRSNEPPDLFGYDTGPGFGGVLAQAGLVYDMTQAYEDFGWTHFDWAKQRCTYDGKVSCLPDQVEEVGYYYNKTLFDEKGFEEPQTLEEFHTLAAALKADGMTPIAYGNGGDDTWTSGHQFSMTASNLLGREGIDARLYSEEPWNSPEVVQAIDIFFRDFVDRGYFADSPTALGYEDANELFYAGEAAMLPTGTWLVGDITERADFEAGFFPFPAIDDQPIAPPAGIGAGLFMAANSPNPEAALVVADFLQSEEEMRRRMEELSQIPAFPIDTEGLDLSPLFQEVVEDLAESSGESAEFGYNIDVLTPARFNEVMATGFQEVMNGDRTPQEQADALQAAYEEAAEAGETLERPE
jgi:raffinose/stachyose/melibiose transport system substrate-binding protein